MDTQSTPKRQIIITKEAQGNTVVEYLSKRFTYFNSLQWQTEITEGRVLVNGETPFFDFVLKEKDKLLWQPEPYEEPEVPMEYTILYEDDDFLFIDKPAGLPCHPSGRFLFHTLWSLLKKKYSHISFINRLDRETSGIVLIAKNSEAAAFANLQMSHHRIQKEYVVLVDGLFPQQLKAYGYLELDENAKIRKKLRFIAATETNAPQSSKENPLSCQTDFELIQHSTILNGVERSCSLVRARIHTGRTHQIRASLCSLGWPVIGDKIYGQDEGLFLKFIEGSLTSSDKEILALEYQALHCSRMCLPGTDSTYTEVTSRVPEAWLLAPHPYR